MRRNAVRSMIIGHAVGDALGVPAEFRSRDDLEHQPIVDMTGHGTHDMPAGTWSDDTSLTLCLLESIGRLGRVDADDIMQNFVRWFRDGEFTATGKVFDVGNATAAAIRRYMHGTVPRRCGGRSSSDNGNGALMRIAPLALYLARQGERQLTRADFDLVHEVAALTHGHVRSMIACDIYIAVACGLLNGHDIGTAVTDGIALMHQFYSDLRYRPETSFYRRLDTIDSFRRLPEAFIQSSGYVVETLEAALYCLLTTGSYTECVLRAVNLGEDTDTIAAIAGGLAGVAYGLDDIPLRWRQQLLRADYIDGLCQYFIEGI